MTESSSQFVLFNPDDHTVGEVKAYLSELPDAVEGVLERARVLVTEYAGQNRPTLASLPFPENVAATPEGACLIDPMLNQ